MDQQERQVVAFLETVREARFDLIRCRGKLERAEALCERITQQISGAPGGSGDIHKDGAWAALADQRSMLLTSYRLAVQAELDVENFISQLKVPIHRMLLKLYYVDLLTWPKVCETLEKSGTPYSERQMYRYRDTALEEAEQLWLEKNAKLPPMEDGTEEENEDCSSTNENVQTMADD